jgi:hypothetical protein
MRKKRQQERKERQGKRKKLDEKPLSLEALRQKRQQVTKCLQVLPLDDDNRRSVSRFFVTCDRE